jgi:hypothetical protein
MATADIWRSGGSGRLMEEASGCGAAKTERNGAVSLRRRRMEIRRIKTMANASAANVIVEQPVSKRLRPVSAGGGGSNVVVREEVVVEGGGDGGEVMDDGLCETGNPEDNASRVCGERCSVEWGQESSTKNRRSVCEVIREGGEAEAEAAASSLSQAWERPFGGQSRFFSLKLNFQLCAGVSLLREGERERERPVAAASLRALVCLSVPLIGRAGFGFNGIC